ncbi:hypothetical protein RchiOBHm_Chr2g0096391 [Rosa chinensis]|uniref:Uncharacterized protein n=1 Tax=Rosa chinensis TaxID=74649 RepID=A0A2P6RL51_ROSCH|nr:hypothetical protein RchiOBHm_Chr2g0096391 [Rosa chinensis]
MDDVGFLLGPNCDVGHNDLDPENSEYNLELELDDAHQPNFEFLPFCFALSSLFAEKSTMMEVAVMASRMSSQLDLQPRIQDRKEEEGTYSK